MDLSEEVLTYLDGCEGRHEADTQLEKLSVQVV